MQCVAAWDVATKREQCEYPAMNKPVAAEVDDGLARELDRLAKQTGRTRSVLTEQALRSQVGSEQDFLAKVDAGLADIEAGRLTDHEAVAAIIRGICQPVP